jgi:hypothetical protein
MCEQSLGSQTDSSALGYKTRGASKPWVLRQTLPHWATKPDVRASPGFSDRLFRAGLQNPRCEQAWVLRQTLPRWAAKPEVRASPGFSDRRFRAGLQNPIRHHSLRPHADSSTLGYKTPIREHFLRERRLRRRWAIRPDSRAFPACSRGLLRPGLHDRERHHASHWFLTCPPYLLYNKVCSDASGASGRGNFQHPACI